MDLKPFKQTEQTAAEISIFVYVITANALMSDDKLEEAYNVVSEALQRLDKLDEPSCVLTYAAYQVMENLCKKTGRSKEATEYHQILRNYEKALFDALPVHEIEKMTSITKHVGRLPVRNAVKMMTQRVASSRIEEGHKRKYLESLSKLDLHLIEEAFRASIERITDLDVKYIICIAAEIDAKDIGLLFNVDPSSVHTMRYRIKKKFAKDDLFRMVL